MSRKTKVLFVCYGNICRSPTAQGVFEKLLEQRGLSGNFQVDSAGTAGYHVGNPPDMRSQQAAAKRGYDLSHQRSRKVDFADFYDFDHIIAMDKNNHKDLTAFAPKDLRDKIKLMLDYGTSGLKEVPDPYYGGEHGFEKVLDLLEEACEGLLTSIKKD